WTEIFNGGQRVEIDDHDVVEATAGGRTATVPVPRILVLPDAAGDLMYVVTDLPGHQFEIRWDSFPGAGDLRNQTNVTTDETGLGFVDFSGLGGLELGVDGSLYYYDQNGNSVEPRWLARLDSVNPTVVYNDRDTEIAVYGTRFYDEPGEVMLGQLGRPPTIFLPRTFVSESEVRATVPAGTPPGLYFVETLFSDERIGFLTDVLSVREPLVVDDIACAVQYDEWLCREDPAASAGHYRAASLAGQAITYRATQTSTAVTFITYRGPDQGKARVTIDGTNMGTLDLYSPTPEYQHPVTYSGLPNARHTIVVTVLGQKNPASSGFEVRVDAFRVRTTTVEDDSPGLRYNTWTGLALAQALGGSLRYSPAKEASIYFDFNGTEFGWITARGPVLGKAEVYVDGALAATVNLYNASWQFQYPQLIGGLADGPHHVRIRVLGAHDPRSRGNNVIFDGFSVP
ncbi:MAG: hypothetical protein HY784_05290, partial [Chloroflexi bacterium]|nr:hypothetical protein [Chloroflexota bacterium]